MARTSYEVRTGKRLIAFQNTNTALEAVLEYLRSVGCRDGEITRVAVNAVAWRGATYHAIPLGSE